MNDKRYSSGTSLTKTKKEEWLDRLETAMRDDWPDEVYLDLKKLRVDTTKTLYYTVQSLVRDLYEELLAQNVKGRK